MTRATTTIQSMEREMEAKELEALGDQPLIRANWIEKQINRIIENKKETCYLRGNAGHQKAQRRNLKSDWKIKGQFNHYSGP